MARLRRTRPHLAKRLRAATCGPSKLALTETGLVNNFSIPASWPATLIVQLNDDCANAVANGAVVASFSNGDSPVSLLNNGQGASYSATWQPGTTSAQMVVTLNANAGTLAPATMQLAGGVSQNQAGVPTLAAGGTLNNVNPVVGDPLAPGTIAQVYGGNLASTSVSPGVLPIPTSFNGTFALVGASQVPLYYLSNGQLDVEIPSELAANQQYPIIVSVNGALALPDTITVIPDTPGIVTYLDGPPPNVQDGAHIIAQHNADYSLVNAASPAKPGEYVTMYLVGMGATNPPVASGIAAPSSPLAQLVDHSNHDRRWQRGTRQRYRLRRPDSGIGESLSDRRSRFLPASFGRRDLVVTSKRAKLKYHHASRSPRKSDDRRDHPERLILRRWRASDRRTFRVHERRSARDGVFPGRADSRRE